MAASSSAIARSLLSLRGIVITFPWICQLLLADLLLSALLPLSILAPTLVYDLSSAIAGSVWSVVQAIFIRVNKANITISGAPLPPGESAIVVANHVSWTDFYFIQALAIRACMLPRCRWFAKHQLKWVPFLGWGLWAMGMPLVTRNWVKDRKELDRVFGGITRNKWPIWLISYSEATRYDAKKHAEAVTWCKAHEKPIPRHTLFPRTRGFVATVNALRKATHIKAVYDVTIAYAEGNKFMVAPDIWTTLSTSNISATRSFHVHVDRFALEDLPLSDEDLSTWLEDRWVQKGKRLESLRQDLVKGVSWRNDSW